MWNLNEETLSFLFMEIIFVGFGLYAYIDGNTIPGIISIAGAAFMALIYIIFYHFPPDDNHFAF